MTVGQLSDLIAIALFPLLIRRVGYKWTILAGMIGWIVRYCLYSEGALPPRLDLVFIGIVNHGICYDFLFLTAFKEGLHKSCTIELPNKRTAATIAE